MNTSDPKRKGVSRSMLRGRSGISMIELLVVTSIVLVLIFSARPVSRHLRDSSMVRSGITRVYQLKKSIDQMSIECRGYPIRDADNDWDNLVTIINRCGENHVPMCDTDEAIGPNVFPSGSECDSISLQNLIPGDLMTTTCDASDPVCRNSIRKDNGKRFNSFFVEDGNSPVDGCSISSGGVTTGWNYALVQNPARADRKPVPVVCANILYGSTGSVTVVLNGAGITPAGTRVNDGSGMVAPDGTMLDNPCSCGAWCSVNVDEDGRTGCCKSCTNPTSGARQNGLGFIY